MKERMILKVNILKLILILFILGTWIIASKTALYFLNSTSLDSSKYVFIVILPPGIVLGLFFTIIVLISFLDIIKWVRKT